jgi:hypothetical protein
MKLPGRKQAVGHGTGRAGHKRLEYLFCFSVGSSPEIDYPQLFLAADTRAQPFSSLGAAAGKNGASVFVRHPFPEAVIVDHFPVGWLKCSFHRFNSNRSRLNQSLLL